MKRAHPKRPQVFRRATHVALRADLVEEARRLEARLEVLVKEARAVQWRKDNAQAVAAYARYFAKHGIWNEDIRGW